MDDLRKIVMIAVGDLHKVLMPLQGQDDIIRPKMNQNKHLAENLAHLETRDHLIQPRMDEIARQKDLVEAAVSSCEPEGETKDLVTAFFRLVEALQSDCDKIRKDLQEWDEIFHAIDSLEKRKRDLQEEELAKAKEILDMKAKDEERSSLLDSAWDAIAQEMFPNRQGEGNAPPGGPWTGIH